MAYTNDNLNSEELAELYNSEAKNIMFPENPVGNFIYQMHGHTSDDELLFKMANANNIFMCDDIHLSKIGGRYGIIKLDDFTNLEYRLLIALSTFPVGFKAIMEKVLRFLFFDSVTNVNDIYIGESVSNFKFSSMNKNNNLMSDQNTLNDLMSTKTDTFVIFVPDSVDKTSLCNVLTYLDLPYTVDGGCSSPVIDVILLPSTEDDYNYVFRPDVIYDVTNFDDNYSIEIGSPDISKLIINNGELVIDSDSYNRIVLLNNTQFYVNGEHQGVILKNNINIINDYILGLDSLDCNLSTPSWADKKENRSMSFTNPAGLIKDADGGLRFLGNTTNCIINTNMPQSTLNSTDFTIELMVKFDSDGMNQYRGIMGLGYGSNGVEIGAFSGSNYNIVLGSPALSISTSLLSSNSYIHQVITRSGTMVKCYLNGALVASGTPTLNFNYNNFIFGRSYDHEDAYPRRFKGVIRHFNIFNRALNETEINTNYNYYLGD